MRIGWSRFIAWALLGEVDQALEELDRIANSPYHHGWYDLQTYSFDADYATVLGNPDFVASFDRISDRADAMREEYLMSDRNANGNGGPPH